MKENTDTTDRKKRETLIFRIQWWHDLETLPTDKRLEMLSHIMKYVEDGIEPGLDGFEALYFNNVRQSIDKAMDNYDARLEADSKRRTRKKVCALQCASCKKRGECKKKERFAKSGKCDEAQLDNAAKEKISECSSCKLMSSCKMKYKYVKDSVKAGECPQSSKSSNKYDSYKLNDSIDNTSFSSTDVSENNDVSIPSSSPKEKRKVTDFSGGAGGGGSVSYDREKILSRMEGRGVDRQWASATYDDLEAIGFRTGRSPITNLVSFMVSKWENHLSALKRKQAEENRRKEKDRAEQDAIDRKLGRGVYAVPKKYVDIIDGIKKHIRMSGVQSASFMEAFTLSSVSDTEIVISAKTASTFEAYANMSDNEFEKEIARAFPGRKVRHAVISE